MTFQFGILIGFFTIMILQAFFWYKKNTTLKSYISSDRKITTRSSFISSQTAVSSIPIFFILPSVIKIGLTDGVVASLSILSGVVFVYILMAERLRIYSEIMGECQTVPSYISMRFKDSTGWLRPFSAAMISVFMVLLASYMISITSTTISFVCGINKTFASILISAGIIFCLYLGGGSASVFSDKLKSLFVFSAAVISFFYFFGDVFSENLDVSTVNMIPKMLKNESLSALNLISYMGIPLGFFGFPTLINRFLIINERKLSKRFCIPSVIWCVFCICCMLIVCYCIKSDLFPEAVWESCLNIIRQGKFGNFIESVFYSLIFLSIISILTSIAGGALFSASTVLFYDILNDSIMRKSSEKKRLISNKITVVSLGVISLILSARSETLPITNPSFIWAIMGSCFGPVMLFSLYCSKLTVRGSVASIISGFITVLVWRFALSPLGGFFSLYEMLPGFCIATIFLYIISYTDKQKSSKRILNEFGRMRDVSKM